MPRFATGTALALCLAAPVQADVTPQQVWSGLVDNLGALGYSVSATETMEAGALTVTDLTMTAAIPDEDATVTIAFGGLRFAEAGDAAVAFTYASPMPVSVRIDDADDPVEMMFDLTHQGLTILVSGTPEPADTYPRRTASGSR